MESGQSKTDVLHYRRSRFITHLPIRYLFSPTHSWLEPQAGGVWRVGLTQFATRMLGELVDHGVDVKTGQAVRCGEVLGWVEGFKAISDLFCAAEGAFAGTNPLLQDRVHLISKDPYQAGWIYQVKGEPAEGCLDAPAYAALLDRTIDRILEKRGPANA